MARRTQAWLEKGRFALALAKMGTRAKADFFGSKRGTLARRLIAEIDTHPAFADGRHPAGPAHIIDLAIIRDALGARWNHYADAIHHITTRTIERHLDHAHSYVRLADCYVLTFRGATPYAAMNRTRAISSALVTYLMGNGGDSPEAWSDQGRKEWKPRLALPRVNWARLSDRLKSLFRSIPAFVTGVLNADDLASRRSMWTRKAVEPRVFTSTAIRIETGAPDPKTTFAASSEPIAADSFTPSRSTHLEPVFHSPANDDGVLSHAGTPPGPFPRIAADFRAPSQSTTGDEIDLDETNALENAMKAAVERLARESEDSIDIPSFRRSESRAAASRPTRRGALGER